MADRFFVFLVDRHFSPSQSSILFIIPAIINDNFNLSSIHLITPLIILSMSAQTTLLQLKIYTGTLGS